MTSPDVPRRARPGQSKRVRSSLNSTGVHSAQGAAGAARPVSPPRTPQIYQPPAAPSGVIASAEFIDSAVGPTNGVLAHGAEFGTLTGDGDTSWADIAPISGSQNAARILQPGWYSVHIWASFGGLTTGDHVQVEATCAYFSQSCTGGGAYLPLGPTTVAAGSITPFYLYPGDEPIEILGAAYGPGTAYVQALHLFIAKQTGLAV